MVRQASNGAYGLSRLVQEFLGPDYDPKKLKRNDPRLVLAVETLENLANGPKADLEVVSIPDLTTWFIRELEGGRELVAYARCGEKAMRYTEV